MGYIAWFLSGFLCGNWSVRMLLMTTCLIVAVAGGHALLSDGFDGSTILTILAMVVVHQAGYFANILFRAYRPDLIESLTDKPSSDPAHIRSS